MVDKNVIISPIRLFNAQVLAKSGTATAYADLSQTTGKCKLGYTIAGTGTAKIEAEESINGTYVTKSPELGTTLGAGSGIITYDAAGIPYVRFVITEDGGVNPVTVTLWIASK
jgi:hypothetical protein